MSTHHGGPSSTDGPPAASPADSPAPAATLAQPHVPVLADGVQLIGETKGSGYREAPSLVRRADGQTLQLTRLLYLVLAAVDGRRSLDEIAEKASAGSGRLVTAENVRTLIDSQLLPLGVLRLADGSQPEVKKSNPLLGMRFRYTVTDPERTRKLTAPFAALFHPVIVVAVTAAFLAVSWWVLMVKGLASATHEAFANPSLVLLVVAVTVLSAGFHEFGHAAAARRGGATPGAMGAGLYLIWPAFYTDVTDSYRLGLGGRIRTDLGGLYFNAIVAVAIVAAWWATGFDALLLVVVTQLLQMVRQLLPLVRFDGYHILADATGVPDLFQRIKPTLLSLLPWRKTDPAAQLLKPWARAVVTAWVLITVPLLIFSLVMMVLSLPRLLGTAWSGAAKQSAQLSSSLGSGDVLDAAVRILAIAAIALPVLGIGYILIRLARQLITGLWAKTQDRPLQRGTAVAAILAIAAGLAWAWWPAEDSYRPVQPYERGTLVDATTAILPFASATGLQEGRSGKTVALWPAGASTPTRDEPQLSMVLVPRDAGSGTAAPSWVFPFDKPAAAEEGDSQALAVNTTNGTTIYDVAFALVWADDGQPVDTKNEAYAYANCTDCAAVAVGFQVVLIVGQTNVIVPENLSTSANYDCVRCLTYALASQLVLTLDGPLSTDNMGRLNALWQEIADYGRNLQNVPLSEIQGRLAAFQDQIKEIIKADPSASPARGTGTATTPATPTGTTSPSPGGTASPGATGTATPAPGTSASTGAGTASPRPTTTGTAPAPGQSAPATQPAGPTPAPTATAPATGAATAPATGTAPPAP